MSYRLYFTIPSANASEKVPTKFNEKYGWSETNELDEQVAKHPTWLEYQEHYRAKFGAPDVYRKFKGEKFLIIGGDFTALSGVITELEKLGAGKSAPNYTIWGADEINAFEWDKEIE